MKPALTTTLKPGDFVHSKHDGSMAKVQKVWAGGHVTLENECGDTWPDTSRDWEYTAQDYGW